MPESFPLSPLRLVVLISGGGTTLRNLIARIADGSLDAQITRVISSRPDARGLQHAGEACIPTAVLSRRDHESDDKYSDAIFDVARESKPHLIVMAGFLKFIPIPADFAGRVVNIHPALIPSFCGAGMYGHFVHEAALRYGVKLSGCTVHFVDNQYDHGPIILQRAVPVLDDDTPEALAARVFEAECLAYPEALRLYAAGRLQLDGRRVRIRP